MDLLSIGQQEKKISLLTLPRSDLIVEAKHGSSNADEDKAATTSNNQENEKPSANKQLVLMQLPKGMSMSELASGCHFFAPRANDSNKRSPAARQASLVVESKQQSYSVSRLETSNVLILVPPAQDTTRTVPIKNSTATTKQPQENNGPSPSKKAKVSAVDTSKSTSSSTLLPVSARLLQPGGSGASFLELRRKMLRPGDLLALLQKHLFDPYNNSISDKRGAITNPYSSSSSSSNNNKASNSNEPLGRTIESLARELQCSQGQVKMALPMVQGFLIPSNTYDVIARYGLLSEEALQEAQNGIIATLAESDDFGDYAVKGVDLEAFLPQVVERFPSSQTYPALEHVIRFALTTLIQTNHNQDEMLLQVPATGTVQLDVKKIALCLAHRLFQSQTAPWEESRFCLRWQSELPGVGSVYQTSLDMLRGVAIPVDASNTPRKAHLLIGSDKPASSDAGDSHSGNFWKYFPANKLPLQPEERFQALFKVKSQWALKELEPYLESLVQETNLTQAELLLQYTTNNPGMDKDGKATKVYSFKR